MSEDLDSYLQSWPYQAGSVQARAVQGLDGRMKIQLRLDLGILQMESEGRPDGQTPFGCESLFEHYQKLQRRMQKEGKEDVFKLTPEDCFKLQQEAVQYYHRYLALFQLENFEFVIRDTERNLRVLDLIQAHAEKPDVAFMHQQFRPCVRMMLARARAMIAIREQNYPLALENTEAGIQDIRQFLQQHVPPEFVEQNSELLFLEKWQKQIREERPLTPLEKLRRQMDNAIENEDYERAARLRDALKELG